MMLFFFSVLFLSGCQSFSLQKEEESLYVNSSEYYFKLPMNWSIEEDPQKELNEDAKFGASDTKSNSVMFIRTQHAEGIDEKKMKSNVEKYLKNYYDLNSMKKASFKVGDLPVLSYVFKSSYKKKPAWAQMYYVLSENNIVEFVFYSPVDNSEEKRKQVFEEVVKTLREKVDAETVASSEEKTTAYNRFETEDMSIYLSSYKVEKQDANSILVIRYVFTNKGKESLVPSEQWNKLIVASQNDKELQVFNNEDITDTELSYLLSRGNEEAKKGKTVESAVIYYLHDEAETVTFTFNQSLLAGREPLVLDINQ
ncbi:hypothetical protein RV18_GL001354 [Enterococcus termitis]|nr:hypothetical protein RV18_GL001354 [Enterococcus termitis]